MTILNAAICANQRISFSSNTSTDEYTPSMQHGVKV
jgi:hypothetical protein